MNDDGPKSPTKSKHPYVVINPADNLFVKGGDKSQEKSDPAPENVTPARSSVKMHPLDDITDPFAGFKKKKKSKKNVREALIVEAGRRVRAPSAPVKSAPAGRRRQPSGMAPRGRVGGTTGMGSVRLLNNWYRHRLDIKKQRRRHSEDVQKMREKHKDEMILKRQLRAKRGMEESSQLDEAMISQKPTFLSPMWIAQKLQKKRKETSQDRSSSRKSGSDKEARKFREQTARTKRAKVEASQRAIERGHERLEKWKRSKARGAGGAGMANTEDEIRSNIDHHKRQLKLHGVAESILPLDERGTYYREGIRRTVNNLYRSYIDAKKDKERMKLWREKRKLASKMRRERLGVDEGTDLPNESKYTKVSATFGKNTYETKFETQQDARRYYIDSIRAHHALPINEKLALIKKSEKENVDYDVIKEIYQRGIEDWVESNIMDKTPYQHAFNRINSFIAGGSAVELDGDLLAEVKSPSTLRSLAQVARWNKGTEKGRRAAAELEKKKAQLKKPKAREIASHLGDLATGKGRADPHLIKNLGKASPRTIRSHVEKAVKKHEEEKQVKGLEKRIKRLKRKLDKTGVAKKEHDELKQKVEYMARKEQLRRGGGDGGLPQDVKDSIDKKEKEKKLAKMGLIKRYLYKKFDK